MVKFLQINVGKRAEASDELNIKCKSEAYDIVMISEPSAFNGRVRKLEGGTIFHTTTITRRIRACMWIQDELAKHANCITLNQFTNEDMVTVKLNLKLQDGVIREVILCSAYLPGLNENKTVINNPISENLAKLTEHCRTENTELIISCDANAHHHIWGSRKSNSRGHKMLQFITWNNFKLLNEGNTPTFTNIRTGTVIDLTLASQGIGRKISGWKVLEEDSYSDHKYITFELGTKEEEPTLFRNKKKTDWEKYRHLIINGLEAEEPVIPNTGILDIEAQKLNDLIYKSYLDSCREKKTQKEIQLVVAEQ